MKSNSKFYYLIGEALFGADDSASINVYERNCTLSLNNDAEEIDLGQTSLLEELEQRFDQIDYSLLDEIYCNIASYCKKFNIRLI